MLRSIKQLIGDKLGTSDGEMGQIKDFYFDDQKWVVRYVVADTGSWLPGRQVLIAPHSFGQLEHAGNVFRVNLTRKQIENSPSIELHQPVSRQYEEQYHQYYGWPYYWQADALQGRNALPIVEEPVKLFPEKPTLASDGSAERSEAHLRSAQAVNGYHLQASDGTIGHICDFLMDPQNWAIRQLVIKIGHRFSGKEVLIPASKVDRISYQESTVFVTLTKAAVEQSPAHDFTALDAVA